MNIETVRTLIETGLSGAKVQVKSEDDRHFQACIISEHFSNQTPVQRHQMVYKTLGDKVGNEIHALSITTYTPREWEQQQSIQSIGCP